MKRYAFPMLALIVAAAACSSGTTPSGTPRTTSLPSASQAMCAARAVPSIQLPCPIQEFGSKDLTAQGSNVHVTFTLGETSFGPTFVKAKSGAHVTVSIDTDSPFNHNFIIDGVVRYDIAPAKSGQHFDFTLPANGPVRFYCTFHVARGMQGAFYFS